MQKLVLAIDVSSFDYSSVDYISFEYSSKDEFILDFMIKLDECVNIYNEQLKIYREHLEKVPKPGHKRLQRSKEFMDLRHKWLYSSPSFPSSNFIFCNCVFDAKDFSAGKHPYLEPVNPEVFTLEEWFDDHRPTIRNNVGEDHLGVP